MGIIITTRVVFQINYLQGFLGDPLAAFWATGGSFSSIHLIRAPPLSDPEAAEAVGLGFTVGTICDGRNCCFRNRLKLGAQSDLPPLLMLLLKVRQWIDLSKMPRSEAGILIPNELRVHTQLLKMAFK